MQRDLPLAVDLLAAALSAGSPLDLALEIVGQAIRGSLGARLQQVATALRLGAPGKNAWSVLAVIPECAPLGRALATAADGGGSPQARLSGLADEARIRARWAIQARARTVGARAAAPLGLCFLPAFVLLGIVPLVVATAESVF